MYFSILVRHTDRFTGKLIQSSFEEFWGVTQAVLLENSSKRKRLVEKNISRILWGHTGRFTGKLIQTIFQRFWEFIKNKGEKTSFSRGKTTEW